MNGLIVLPFWTKEILENNKVWEIRRNNCHIRGKIYIIASGTKHIYGECEIIDSFPLTKELFEENFDKHHINCTYEELPPNYKYVWLIKNAVKYEKPIPFKYKGSNGFSGLAAPITVAISRQFDSGNL